MAIDDQDLQQFATDTVEAGASEVALRAGISRAYYSVFHCLAPMASQLPRSRVCPKDVDRLTHSELVERLKEWRTEALCPRLSKMTATKDKLWRAVEAASGFRVLADYRLNRDISLAEAQTQIARVKLIKRYVQQIASEIDRDAPQSSIQDAG